MADFGKIDWRVLQRYTSSQGIKDFDLFLDSLPINVGYNALIAAGMVWVIAGAAVLFASMQVEKVTSLRAEMIKVEALQPPIPQLVYSPVSQQEIETLGKKINETYPGINVSQSGEGRAIVSAQETGYFPQFMAAISTLENGGKNWRITLDEMCMGRDCVGSKLSATLKVEFARISEPKKTE